MAARFKLTVDWFNKKLIKSKTNSAAFTLPNFFQGDVMPFQIQVVEPNPNGTPSDFVVVDIANAGLKVALVSTPTGTPSDTTIYASQFSWSQNLSENYFYGNLALNTSEINTLLGAAQTATAWFEIELTEASAITTLYQAQVNIYAEGIETGSLEVAPGETPLSLEIATALFPKKQTDAGDRIVLVSADGTKGTILYTHDDGSFRQEPVAL